LPVIGHLAVHSVLAEHSDLPLTAPGAAVVLAVSEQQPDFFSPTAPGAAAAFLVAQHSDLVAPTAPGAELCVVVQAPRKATRERAAMVVIFIEEILRNWTDESEPYILLRLWITGPVIQFGISSTRLRSPPVIFYVVPQHAGAFGLLPSGN
jgi:hypothetical protein